MYEEYEIKIEDAFKQIFKNSVEEVWNLLDKNIRPEIKENVVLIDIRGSLDYDNYHIPCAVDGEKGIEKYLDKTVYIICNRGNSSRELMEKLRAEYIEAYSLVGGMEEWGRLNYPKWRPSK